MSWAIVTHKSKSASHGQKRTAAAVFSLPCYWVGATVFFSAHIDDGRVIVRSSLFLFVAGQE
jgi:hypothetical protein